MNNETNKVYPGIGESIAFTFVFIVLFVLSSWAIQIWFKDRDTLLYYTISCLRYLLVYGSVIAMALSAKRKYVPTEKLLHIKPIGTKAYLFIIIAFFCETLLENKILSWLPPPPLWLMQEYTEVDSSLVYSLVLVCIIAPVCEEIIFRGIILEGLLQRYHAPSAIVISSLLFGSIHLNLWQFVAASAGGMLSGWVYYKTRSVLPCIWLHAINNLMSVLVFLPYTKGKSLSEFDFKPPNNIMVLITLVLLFITLKALSKHLKTRSTLPHLAK